GGGAALAREGGECGQRAARDVALAAQNAGRISAERRAGDPNRAKPRCMAQNRFGRALQSWREIRHPSADRNRRGHPGRRGTREGGAATTGNEPATDTGALRVGPLADLATFNSAYRLQRRTSPCRGREAVAG